MPRLRHIFLNAVEQIPSSNAAILAGLWNSCDNCSTLMRHAFSCCSRREPPTLVSVILGNWVVIGKTPNELNAWIVPPSYLQLGYWVYRASKRCHSDWMRYEFQVHLVSKMTAKSGMIVATCVGPNPSTGLRIEWESYSTNDSRFRVLWLVGDDVVRFRLRSSSSCAYMRQINRLSFVGTHDGRIIYSY